MADIIQTIFSRDGLFASGGLAIGVITNLINNRYKFAELKLANEQKITELMLSNEQKLTELKHDEATAIRHELKEKCDKLEIYCDKLKIIIDEWQQKYYLETSELNKKLATNEARTLALSSQLRDLESRSGVDESRYG